MNTAEILNFHREEQHVKADLKNGFAQISVDLIHCLAKRNLTAYQTRLLWVVIEECYGLEKYDAKPISLNKLEESTGLDRRHIIRARTELIAMRILVRKDGAIGINRNTWEWREKEIPAKTTGVPDKAQGVPIEAPQGVPYQAPEGVPVQAQKGVPVEEPYIDIKEDINKTLSIPDAQASDKKGERIPAEPKKQPGIWLDDSFTFQGITPQQIGKWADAYPAINIRTEIAKAETWLQANPKNRKSNYQRFLVNWLARAQDKAPRVNARQQPARYPDEFSEWRE